MSRPGERLRAVLTLSFEESNDVNDITTVMAIVTIQCAFERLVSIDVGKKLAISQT